MAPRILGYIVQHLEEEMLAPPIGAKKLFSSFDAAMQHAKELYQLIIQMYDEGTNEIFEVYSPTKEHTDLAGGSLIFRSRDTHIWIDCILQ